MLEYRFETTSDLNGHALGNLILTSLFNITGNLKDSISNSDLELMGRDIQRLQDLIDQLETAFEEEQEENNVIANEIIANEIEANEVGSNGLAINDIVANSVGV